MLDGRLATVLGASLSAGFSCVCAGTGSSALGSAFFAGAVGAAGVSFGEGASARGASSLSLWSATFKPSSGAPLVG